MVARSTRLRTVTSVALVDVCQGWTASGPTGRVRAPAPSPPDGTCPLGHVYHAPVPAIYLPPWRIDVTRRPGVPRLVPATVLARAMAGALEAAGAPAPAAVGLILSDDRELARLNRVAMAKDGPTDVLSFPLLPPSAHPPHAGQDPAARRVSRGPAFALPPGRRTPLGQRDISVDRAIAQAAQGRGGQTGDVRWSAAGEPARPATQGATHRS